MEKAEAESKLNAEILKSLDRYISGLITREEFNQGMDNSVKQYLNTLKGR